LLGTSFWLGLGCGGALGAAMLLFALVTHPEQTRTRLRQAQAVADAMARPLPSASRPAPGSARAVAPTQAAFDMRIRRGEGGMAPLALRILGLDSAQNVEVLLRELPATAQLSRGVRRDESTWALRLAELEDLQLTFGENTPDAFDMIVEVASARGTRIAKAVAHVRVSEQRDVAGSSAPPPPAVAGSIDHSRQQPLTASAGAPGVDKPFRTEVALAQSDEPAPAQRAAPRRPG
jgi:hypothetical protein